MGGSYTTIPNAPTAVGTFGFGLNDFGKIVGYYVNGQSDPYGFAYDNGSYTTLLNSAAYQGGIGNFGVDVNNSGIVVGFYNPGDHYQSFSYDGNTYTPIEDPLATDGTLVTGINDQGQRTRDLFAG